MEYLRFLKEQSSALGPRFLVIALLAGVSNGILVGVIISGASDAAVVMNDAEGEDAGDFRDGQLVPSAVGTSGVGNAGPGDGQSSELRTFIMFIASFLLFTLTRRYILDRTTKIVESVILKIRIRIVELIPRTELPAFERIGKTRIQQALSQDVLAVSEAAFSVTSAFASLILVVCAFAYIAMLSKTACLVILGSLALGALVYHRNFAASRDLLESSWQTENSFFDHLSDELEGFNELKVNPAKAHDLLENDVKAMARRSEEYKLRISQSFNRNMVFGQAFFYLVMAMCIFVLPRMVEGDDMPVLQILSVILFINGPVAECIAAAPFLAKANFAIKNIQQLEKELETVATYLDDESALPAEDFQLLRCDKLTYRYPRVGQREFVVGPLDLEIRRGEIIFLIGGNGTGKSTFLKLLCGLLPPADGDLVINDRIITPPRFSYYRSHFAIILQDFRLFRRLIGVDEIDRVRVDDLLAMLRLTKITGVDPDGRFASTKLSTGQRKRLALLVVEMDNREIYVFDEWAADQDPEFRKYFYEIYLEDLRARGKTIIAATHDDHYFHIADRVIKMADGKISSVVSYRSNDEPTEAPL